MERWEKDESEVIAMLDQVQVPSNVIDQMYVQRQHVIRPSSIQEAQAVVRVYQMVCTTQSGEGSVRRVCAMAELLLRGKQSARVCGSDCAVDGLTQNQR